MASIAPSMTCCGVASISAITRSRNASVPGTGKKVLMNSLAWSRYCGDAERAKQRPACSGGAGRPAQQAVHRHQRGDFFRRVMMHAAEHRRAHAVADEHGLVHFGIAQHREHGLGKKIHRISRLRLVALAVAGQVNQNEPRLVRQRRNLFAPETQMARPAMNEDDGVVSFAGGDVMNPVRADGNKMRLGVSRAGEGSDCWSCWRFLLV